MILTSNRYPSTDKPWPTAALAIIALCTGASAAGQNLDFAAALDHLPRALQTVPAQDIEKNWLASMSAKVDPSLLRLGEQAQSKSAGEVAAKAFELGVPYDAGLVAVSLSVARSSERAALIREIEAKGGTATTTLGDLVYARLPAAQLSALALIDELGFAGPQPQFFPTAFKDYGTIISEGVEITRVDRFHQAGVKGQGVKIGIMDFGFQRYEELLRAGEVPQPAAYRAFNQAGQLEANTVHGTACAEIIYDMAPEAELYLAAVDGRTDQIIQAAQWLAQQGVDILSFSGGGHDGPHDGSSQLDLLVDQLVSQYGLLWVNSAGNSGAEHWTGLTEDRNRNGVIDIPENQEDGILLEAGGEQLTVLVHWDDWGSNPQLPAASQDIDAYLLAFDANSQRFTPVAKSTNPQNGRGRPIEFIAINTVPGQIFALVLKAEHIDRAVRIHAYGQGAARVQPAVAAGSIGIPATSPNAFAVGAVDVQTAQLEPFSSQGPTDDGRTKPEVSAPDQNLSLAYGQQGQPGRFPGTSAACPHVSGFAALFKQMEPDLKAQDLGQAVIRHVRAIGAEVPNNQHGYGHIDAGNAPPPDSEREPRQQQEDKLRFLDPIIDLLDKKDKQ